jgi:multicomponent Na+:H+ antiporter subunit D
VTDLIVIAPILLPLVLAAVTAALWMRPGAQAAVTILGMVGLLTVSVLLVAQVMEGGSLVTELGDWPAPFGIVIVVDRLSAAMVLVSAILAIAAIVFTRAEESRREYASAGFYPLFCGLLVGVNGAFMTGDIFNLYVWFEVMLICTLGLLVVNRNRAQIDAAVKYAILNLFGTVVLLVAIGFLYGITGTLNMAHLAVVLPTLETTPALAVTAILFLIAFGIKMAAFPLFFWLPLSYHTAPMSVAAIFAGLLTKVGVYAALRVFTLLFEVSDGGLNIVVAWAAALTMVTGVLGAVVQMDVRRILSFHIISQIGYMMIGIALATPVAIAAAVFYIVHHIIVKANLFLLAGAIREAGGSYDLARVGGLMKSNPWLAVLFLIPALSLAGLPPLSGFWAKLLVIDASLQANANWLAGVALVVGLLTLLSMSKIWMEAFWKAAPDAAPARRRVPVAMVASIAFLGAITVGIGLYAEPLVAYSQVAGTELSDPSTYIDHILPEPSRIVAGADAIEGGAE